MELSRSEKEALLVEVTRRKALKDLFFFSKEILGYDLEEVPHRELCEFIGSPVRRKLVLLPRGTYKTSVISQSYPVWRICQDPNQRILLDSEVIENSWNNLRVISDHLSKTQGLLSIFGQHKSRRWTQDYIVTAKRTNLKLRDPTVATTSLASILQSGPHYTLIIADDLHSEKNSTAKADIAQVYQRFRSYHALLEPDGEIIIVGTRWADRDLYSIILEDHRDFSSMIRSAYLPDGKLYFPSRLNTEYLDSQKSLMGISLFNSQYCNDPLPSQEIASFRKEWFRYSEDMEPERIYVCCDAAISTESKRSDFSSISAGGITKRNEFILADYARGKWQPYELIQKILSMADKHRNKVMAGGGIGIETNVFQRLLKFELEREMKRTGRFYRIIELNHRVQKLDRVLSLQGLYSSGNAYHRPWMKGGDLEEELLWFPRGRHDDLADAAASVLEICKPYSQNFKQNLSMEALKEAASKELDELVKYPLKDRIKGKKNYWTFPESEIYSYH